MTVWNMLLLYIFLYSVDASSSAVATECSCVQMEVGQAESLVLV